MQTKDLSDIGIISAFMAKGYEPVGRYFIGRKAFFTFEWDDNMETLFENYLNNNFDVDAQTQFATIKAVKTWIYQNQGQRQ